jgi:hypothetical protein
VALDWSILNSNGPVDIAGTFARGYQIGSAIIDKFHERNALAALAQQPNDPRALSTLYQVNPQLGAHFEERGQQLEASRRQSAIAQQYAGGDTQGAETAAIGAGEFDLAKQLTQMDDAKRTKTAVFFKAAGPLAYKMRQMTDPAQRKAFLDANRPMLEAEGVNPQAIDSFDVSNDQALDGLIAGNQTVDQLVSQGEIKWHPVPGDGGAIFATDAMGRPVGAQNPFAKGGTAPTPTPAPANGAKLSAAQAWQFIGPHEGGYSAHDGNGAPVNFGINQSANPDIDVSKLDAGKAQQLFEQRYWGPSGAASLPAPLAAVHADTYFISPAKSKEILAQSGGDPSKYMDLRDAWMQHLASTPKYARFARAWTSRNHDLREFASELSGGPGASSGVQAVSSKAEFDGLPSGTMFIAPDGSRRVKP